MENIENLNVRYMYLRDKRNNPHTCVSMCVDKDNNKIYYQLVTLSNKEGYFNDKTNKFVRIPFIKQNTRNLAYQNLLQTPRVIDVKQTPQSLTFHSIARIVLDQIGNSYETGVKPATRARRAARSWLKKADKKYPST